MVRTGGMLVAREVQFFIDSSQQLQENANSEFYGGKNVLKFEPGEHMKNATIIAVADGIPEV